MQQHPAAQCAEHAFQAHDQAAHGRVHIPLAQNLQRVGHAAGHHAAVQQGHRVHGKFRRGRVLQQQRCHRAFHRHHKELPQAQAHAIHLRTIMVHRHDLETEQHGAQQQHHVAAFHAAKAVLHAQQIQPAHRNGHAEPQLGAAAAAQCQPEDGHQHHIHRREEACFGRGGVQCQAELLGSRRHKQQRAAHKAGPAQAAALLRRFRCPSGAGAALTHQVKHLDRGQQHQHRQPAAPGQKAAGSHAGTGALGHEGRAPDKRAQQQQKRILALCIHQPTPSTLSRP